VENAPLITVLMPTYNRAHILGRVYESLLAQTFPRPRSYANYTRFSLHAVLGVREQATEAPSTAAWVLIAPLGTILYIRDRLRFAEPSSVFIG
jgi:cellulose synthase/poly-beta-1,6-N-acetylglucosamine synthase-like glycosyltransferase